MDTTLSTRARKVFIENFEGSYDKVISAMFMEHEATKAWGADRGQKFTYKRYWYAIYRLPGAGKLTALELAAFLIAKGKVELEDVFPPSHIPFLSDRKIFNKYLKCFGSVGPFLSEENRVVQATRNKISIKKEKLKLERDRLKKRIKEIDTLLKS